MFNEVEGLGNGATGRLDEIIYSGKNSVEHTTTKELKKQSKKKSRRTSRRTRTEQEDQNANRTRKTSRRKGAYTKQPETQQGIKWYGNCLLYTSPSPRD